MQRAFWFFAVFLVVQGYALAEIGAPTPIQPKGVVAATSPTYTWSTVIGATDYYLWVNSPAANVFKQWYPATQVCSGASCAIQPALLLAEGSYTWWVQAKNLTAAGPWSPGVAFTATRFSGPPAAATLTSPTGATTLAMPTYSWNPVTNSTDYYLWVNSSTGNVFKQWYPATQVCASTPCSVKPNVTLSQGTYLWWVQTSNSAGLGLWSAEMHFQITAAGAAPGPATLVAPSGAITVNVPAYTWKPTAGSTDYYLWVNSSTSNVFKQWYPAAQVCSATSCSLAQSAALAAGAHVWWIQTKNAAGAGPWSAAMNFQVNAGGGPPAPATLVSPKGAIASDTPTYTWNAAGSATEYYLWVDGPSGNVFKQWYTTAQACSGATCSIKPALALVQGAHVWWVQVKGAGGTGLWSAGMGFTVSQFSGPPPKATLLEPFGAISDTMPAYKWNAASTATEYYLWVDRSSGNVLKQWYPSSQVCSGATCSVRPPAALAAGAYTWWIQTRNSAGDGLWSAAMTFSVSAGTLPPAATLLSPSGTITGSTPDYTWNAVAAATGYTLVVDGQSGNVVNQLFTPSVCSGATCSATPATALTAGNYSWRIRTRNATGEGPFSTPLNFTLQVSQPSSVVIESHRDGDTVPSDGFLMFGTVATGITGLKATLTDPSLGVTVDQRPVEISAGRRWAFAVMGGQVTQGGTVNVAFTATDAQSVATTVSISLQVAAPDRESARLIARTTFGATPELLNEAATQGASSFLSDQLDPARVDDSAFDALIAGKPQATLADLQTFEILHAIHSRRQLREVLTQFWDNHFNTDVNKEGNLVSYEFAENKAFRQNALGRFENLLRLSAKSPAMMIYLDNAESVAGNPNENYARELMELHALGVDGGYTQRDVENVARAFTGWQVSGGQFFFNQSQHDTVQKVVLGQTLGAGRGIQDGEDVLNILARHASTARFVCKKLAELLVSDAPSGALISACTAEFQARHNDGDPGQIARVAELLLESGEAQAPANFRNKVKTPFEFVAGFARNLSATTTGADLHPHIRNMGMRLFENPVPTGWSETGDDWVDTNLLLQRARFANIIARNTSGTTINPKSYFQSRGLETAEGIAGYLFQIVLQNEFSSADWQQAIDCLTLNGASPFNVNAADASTRLQRLIWTVLSFPGYQYQ